MKRAMMVLAVAVAVAAGAAPAEGQTLQTTATPKATDRRFNLLPGAAWERQSDNRDFLTVVCQDSTPGEWARGANSVLQVDLKIMLRGAQDRPNPWIFTRHGTGGHTQTCDLRKGYDTITWEMAGPIDWDDWPNVVIVARAYPGKNPGFTIGNPFGAAIWSPGAVPGTVEPAASTSSSLALDMDELGR